MADQVKSTSDFQEITEAATLRDFNGMAGDLLLAALPKDSRTEDLERCMPQRRRFRGVYNTASEPDFCEYVNTHARPEESAVFVDPEAFLAVACLQLGNHEKPLHNDHIAKLKPTAMQAFTACTGMHARTVSQRELLEWVEDWREHISGSVDGSDATMTSAQVLAAIRRVQISGSAKTTHEDGPMSVSRSMLAKVEASSMEGTLPGYLHFVCTPYPHFGERQFDLALVIKPEEGKEPQFRLRIRQLDAMREDIAREFAERIKARVLAAPVRIGSFS